MLVEDLGLATMLKREGKDTRGPIHDDQWQESQTATTTNQVSEMRPSPDQRSLPLVPTHAKDVAEDNMHCHGNPWGLDPPRGPGLLQQRVHRCVQDTSRTEEEDLPLDLHVWSLHCFGWTLWLLCGAVPEGAPVQYVLWSFVDASMVNPRSHGPQHLCSGVPER